jgi:ParB family chromosome partitioning protein
MTPPKAGRDARGAKRGRAARKDSTMNATAPRLGRGLDALLGGTPTASAGGTGTAHVETGRIQRNPYQPRKSFDDDELKQLTDSIKSHGILQPLVVRDAGDHYQLIAGERRLRAAQAAGLANVPVHVVAFNDQQVYEAALVENIQRSDLNAIEKAQGFKDYLERYSLTHEQLGNKLGIDRATVSNLVGLLNLPADVQDSVRLGQITLGHAKILKGLNNAERASQLAKQVIMSGLSVHALETLVKAERQAAADAKIAKDAGEPAEKAAPVEKTAHVMSVENELRQRLAVKFEIKVKAQDRGQIVIGFETNDDFERVIDALRK